MSPHAISLVQDSFRTIVDNADLVADTFYNRLFEIAPDVRPMFPEDMSAQKVALMQTFAYAVQNLNDLDTIKDSILQLGTRHAHYGVKDEHYKLAASALLFTLQKCLGSACTYRMQEAWLEVYSKLATFMQNAAKQQSSV